MSRSQPHNLAITLPILILIQLSLTSHSPNSYHINLKSQSNHCIKHSKAIKLNSSKCTSDIPIKLNDSIISADSDKSYVLFFYLNSSQHEFNANITFEKDKNNDSHEYGTIIDQNKYSSLKSELNLLLVEGTSELIEKIADEMAFSGRKEMLNENKTKIKMICGKVSLSDFRFKIKYNNLNANEHKNKFFLDMGGFRLIGHDYKVKIDLYQEFSEDIKKTKKIVFKNNEQSLKITIQKNIDDETSNIMESQIKGPGSRHYFLGSPNDTQDEWKLLIQGCDTYLKPEELKGESLSEDQFSRLCDGESEISKSYIRKPATKKHEKNIFGKNNLICVNNGKSRTSNSGDSEPKTEEREELNEGHKNSAYYSKSRGSKLDETEAKIEDTNFDFSS